MTLSFFPTPYPDETHFSLYARYHYWARNRSYGSTAYDLFGNEKVAILQNIPARLEKLCSKLPEKSYITPDVIISEHSFFRLFRPFLSHKKASKAIEGMKSTMSGLNSVSADYPVFYDYLCFCEQCLNEDEKIYGETYWHRSHQVIGVRICHKHKTWLYESGILNPSQQLKRTFSLPWKGMDGQRFAAESAGDYEKNVEISEYVNWILNNELPHIDMHELRNRYLYYLKKMDLTYFSGMVRGKEFQEKFTVFYGDNMLKALNHEVDSKNRGNWLNILLQKGKRGGHPLSNILLLVFLNIDREEFWRSEMPVELPFGNGPWPCLNPTAVHYRQPVITTCVVTKNSHKKLPIGKFCCDKCGYAYARTGPDHAEEDQYRYSQVVSHGSLWEKRLLSLAAQGLSFREIGRQLKVDSKGVKHHLSRLKCPTKGCKRKREIEKKRKIYRNALTKAIRENPGIGRWKLHNSMHHVYYWLDRHDDVWLKKNLPSPRVRKYHGKQVDWVQRDKILAVSVIMAGQNIRALPGRPIWIRQETIAKAVKDSTFRRYLDFLPLTKEALAKATESVHDWRLRRATYKECGEEHSNRSVSSKVIGKVTL